MLRCPPLAPQEGYWEGWHERLAHVAAANEARNAAALRRFRALACAAKATAALVLGMVLAQRHIIIGRGQDVGPGGERQAAHAYALEFLERVIASAPLQDVGEQARAFGLLAEYYGGGLRWVAQDGRQTELGLGGNGAEGVAAQPAEAPLVVEVFLARVEGERDGRLVSAPMVLMLPGEEANFRMADTAGSGPKRFYYRCVAERGAGGEVAVSVEIGPGQAGAGGQVRLRGALRSRGDGLTPVAYSREGEAAHVLLLRVSQWNESREGDTAT